MIAHQWQGETWLLHPHRVMYRERHRMLIASDLHLGKTGHFRAEGIAVPQAAYADDLHRLFAAIQYFQPEHLVLVGDLFHSRANREWDWFARWRNDLPQLRVTLVKGNHDRLPAGFHEAYGMEVLDELNEGPLRFVHDPATAGNDAACISGHLHPAVRVKGNARQSLRLPCFWFSARQCLLPAFSVFSGTAVVKPRQGDAVFAIAQDRIVPV